MLQYKYFEKKKAVCIRFIVAEQQNIVITKKHWPKCDLCAKEG